jgi:hypothetical protein
LSDHMHWRMGDSRLLRAEVPAKLSKDWRRGFEAGIAALATVLGRREALLVHGARVFTLADHHIDEAVAAARSIAPRAANAGGEP